MRRGSVDTETSRALALAAVACPIDRETLKSHLESASVLISVEPSTPGAASAAKIFIETMRRLPISIGLDISTPGPLAKVLADVATNLDSRYPFVPYATTGSVRIHFGACADDSVLRILPDGTGAHLLPPGISMIEQAYGPEPVGVMYAASLGSAEVFKTIAQTRTRPHEHAVSFSPVTLNSDLRPFDAADSQGPRRIVLVGVGAIGTAALRLLAAMPINGQVVAIDPERFHVENFETYSLGSYAEALVEPLKIEIGAAHARGRDFAFERMSVDDYLVSLEGGNRDWPDTVLVAVDTPDARYQARALWPRTLIDMGTGDTGVTLRDGSGTGGEPCIECMLPRQGSQISAITKLAEATGLDASFLREGRQVTESQLTGLPPDKRLMLESQLGQQVCGLASAVGLSDLPSEHFRPAIPFVAQQAACLGVGRLIARWGGAERLPNLFQYDVLLGPTAICGEHVHPTLGCHCQTRRDIIRKLQSERGLG